MSVLELGLPMTVADGELPERVTIWEVGPRDGLQNEKNIVDLAVKLEFLDRLATAGLTVIEATSMVSPKWVPQLADAEELLARLEQRAGVRYPVLVPNERGLARALESGVTDIAVFASATETFAARNLNNTVDGQFAMFEPVVRQALQAGMRVRGYVSMCWGDPWEGAVDPAAVGTVGRRLLDMGCAQVSLGDTIGVATPGHVAAVLAEFPSLANIAVHFHDTYGQALSNTLAALRLGVACVDSSAGGLGGCPYAKSATGNLATEDLVWMLDGLGIEHGVELGVLAQTSAWLAGELGRQSPSRVVRALTG
ncbi:hydroxymethylglutaryl-CoA lyase [Sciscionella marina]|uniref:hydroxymethylglutaryl-CoA lyase n=1 Tax=Sciscionella marina TaxID=508770 RepID=UPI0003705E35|nr:hydroxymethylglutaryl-CoA lyase [Sciscionella marina]